MIHPTRIGDFTELEGLGSEDTAFYTVKDMLAELVKRNLAGIVSSRGPKERLRLHALLLIRKLFAIEREQATAPPEKRWQIRKEKSRPIVDEFFEWCCLEAPVVLDETPISRAIQHARNQRAGLERFLEDGRLPIHNNFCERQLRREALGRKNWVFLGNDEGGEVNAKFVTLLASCQLHGIEPWAYLRDLFCLMPWWPSSRVLDLAPAYWKKTLEQNETQQRLAAIFFARRLSGISLSIESRNSTLRFPRLHAIC